jgi:hypothetical protein
MTRISDGGYVIVGTTVSSWDGSHIDAFFVKTTSLEQPPEPTPAPKSLAVSDVSGLVQVQTPEQGDAWTQANSNASLPQGGKIKTEEKLRHTQIRQHNHAGNTGQHAHRSRSADGEPNHPAPAKRRVHRPCNRFASGLLPKSGHVSGDGRNHGNPLHRDGDGHRIHAQR